MRKTLLFVVILAVITATIILALFPAIHHSPGRQLEKVLKNLNQIESATYYSYHSGHPPGDTSPPRVYISYVKEYINDADTFVGASFVNLRHDDTTKMTYTYDGQMRTRMNWNENKFETDDFQNNPWPFRVVNAPFFTKAKSIIGYALESEDSLRIDKEDYGDSLKYSFLIYDDIIEIIGNRIIHDTLLKTGKGKISRYDIWIDKSDMYPYRIRREMPHDISELSCKEVKINNNYPPIFRASDYFPPDSVLVKEDKTGKTSVDLHERQAPGWTLYDADSNYFTLGDFKSKVLMIQFSSVSCGPCLQSIAFLKDLKKEYDKSDFDFVSIESFSRTPEVLRGYSKDNDFNYKFLMSTDKLTAAYGVKAVPTFYLLDQNRVIKKIIRGYGKGTTDKEIRNTINDML
ncbi:MAG: TlpA disulfide reductase family protein [Bacteroidales bacterium]